MSLRLAAQIQDALPQTDGAYYKLVLAAGPARSGKTTTLTELGKKRGWPRINVNLQLSEHLLDLTHRQRATRVAGLLDGIVRDQKSEVVLLDNIELLFAGELAQDPLRLLQSLSRNTVIVAAWPGSFDGTCLTYAEPGHPESRRYQTPQAVIVSAGGEESSDSDWTAEQIA